LSNDLLDTVAKSLGIKLANGRLLDDLWQYSIGSDVTGSYIEPRGEVHSISSKEMTNEV